MVQDKALREGEVTVEPPRANDAGLVFIGPPPRAMRAMGDKSAAKLRMIEAGVPTAPGYHGDDQSARRFAVEAERVGDRKSTRLNSSHVSLSRMPYH